MIEKKLSERMREKIINIDMFTRPLWTHYIKEVNSLEQEIARLRVGQTVASEEMERDHKRIRELEAERDQLKEQTKALKDERALNDFKEIEKILSDDNRCSPDCIHDNPSPHDCAKCQDLPPWYFDKKKDLGIDNNG